MEVTSVMQFYFINLALKLIIVVKQKKLPNKNLKNAEQSDSIDIGKTETKSDS